MKNLSKIHNSQGTKALNSSKFIVVFKNPMTDCEKKTLAVDAQVFEGLQSNKCLANCTRCAGMSFQGLQGNKGIPWQLHMRRRNSLI